MKIHVHFNPSIEHHTRWGSAFLEGLKKHGEDVKHIAHYGADTCDLAVFWSHHKRQIIQQQQVRNKDYICLENGYIDKQNHASMSLNGMHGISEEYVTSLDTVKNGWELKPYKKNYGAVCVIGQVPNDKSLWGNDVIAWARKRVSQLIQQTGNDVIFKPHPLDKNDYSNFPCPVVRCDLNDLFNQVKFFVTFSSTVGVDAVMEGIPASAEFNGSMIYNYNVSLSPDKWLKWISHRQWSEQEYRNGTAWEYINAYLKSKR